MCLISVSNLKEIYLGEGWLKVIVLNRCEEEERKLGNFQKRMYLTKYLPDFLLIWYVYIEGIKYLNLIEISQVVIEI